MLYVLQQYIKILPHIFIFIVDTIVNYYHFVSRRRMVLVLVSTSTYTHHDDVGNNGESVSILLLELY